MNRVFQLLTSSRLAALRSCPRRHYYRYEVGLVRSRSATPLRLGSAFHVGLEVFNKIHDAGEAVAAALKGYQHQPPWADATEWAVEQETLGALLAGHFWRYGSDDLEVVAAERVFELPLLNPGSRRASRWFRLAGKIDGIVKLPDGRLAILEYKTCGEDLASDSDYWLRLRCDGQISLYLLAARELGFNVSTVLYDVTRKPTIRLRKGETPQEYGERLLADITERPDYYFARREIPRLEDDLREFQLEVWQQAQQLRDSQRASRWFRNVGKNTCSFCEYAQLCLNAIQVKSDAPPVGYEVQADVHPELSSKGE